MGEGLIFLEENIVLISYSITVFICCTFEAWKQGDLISFSQRKYLVPYTFERLYCILSVDWKNTKAVLKVFWSNLLYYLVVFWFFWVLKS